MTETIDQEIKTLAFGAFIGGAVAAVLGLTLWAISQSEDYRPEVTAGTTIMPGCPDTVLVGLYKGATLLRHHEENIAEGFHLLGPDGRTWQVKVKN